MCLPALSLAAGIPDKIVPCDGTKLSGTECTVCSLATLAQNVLNTGIFIAVFFSAIMFAWAGWELLTSQGNEEKYSKAKTIFLNVFIGLIIILAAWLVVDTLMRALLGAKFGPWSAIC